jgi:hypothetical protein
MKRIHAAMELKQNNQMMKAVLAILIVMLTISCYCTSKPERVTFRNDTDRQKVEIFIGEKLLACYLYAGNLEKQSLYPIFSASGKIITRGYPLNPRLYEKADAPHQPGMWFSYGNLNGLDFWNNTNLIPPDQKAESGSIRFREILSQSSGTGELKVSSDWADAHGKVLLHEVMSYLCSGRSGMRSIIRTTILTAVQADKFFECKEGLMAIWP